MDGLAFISPFPNSTYPAPETRNVVFISPATGRSNPMLKAAHVASWVNSPPGVKQTLSIASPRVAPSAEPSYMTVGASNGTYVPATDAAL